jgi:hypothetical protein
VGSDSIAFFSRGLLLKISLRALHAEAGSGVVDVEEEVGCSSLPGEAAQAAAAGDSPSSTSGNSVAGGQSTARGELGVRAEVSVIDGADGGERAVVSGWKRRSLGLFLIAVMFLHPDPLPLVWLNRFIYLCL